MSERNRIIHLVSHDGNWESFFRITALAAALREHGFQSVIAAPEQSRLAELGEMAGVEVAAYTLENSINPLRWKRLGDFVKQSNAGLVHLHDGASARLMSKARVFSGSTAVVATRYETASGLGGADFGGGVDAVACPSLAAREAYLGKGASSDKIFTVYGGINMAMAEREGSERDGLRAQFRAQYCPGKEKPLFIVNIAPLEASSRQGELLEMMPDILAARPQAHLVIMGEGSLEEELRRRARILALENEVSIIEPDKAFHRLVTACDVYAALDEGDVSGLMVQAAAAAGRVVAAVDSGCYGELIEDGKTGVLSDVTGFKDALVELLQSRTRREHLGRMAGAGARKRFSMTEIARDMAYLYNRVLDAASGA